MNTHTPFRLESPVVTDLTRLDLSDDENVKDAAHQLRRCLTPADYEAWARTWGDGLIRAADFAAKYESDDFVSADEVKELEHDCAKAEKSAHDLQTAMEQAETALDRLTEDFDLGSKLAARIDGIVNGLEAARTEA